jgi:hypothetical protein
MGFILRESIQKEVIHFLGETQILKKVCSDPKRSNVRQLLPNGVCFPCSIRVKRRGTNPSVLAKSPLLLLLLPLAKRSVQTIKLKTTIWSKVQIFWQPAAARSPAA